MVNNNINESQHNLPNNKKRANLMWLRNFAWLYILWFNCIFWLEIIQIHVSDYFKELNVVQRKSKSVATSLKVHTSITFQTSTGCCVSTTINYYDYSLHVQCAVSIFLLPKICVLVCAPHANNTTKKIPV